MPSDWPEASETAMHAQDMLDQAADFGRMLMERDAETARLAGQVAALREALAGILESYEFCLGDELALSDLTKAVMRGGVHRRAGAGTRSPGGGGRGGAGVSGTGQGGPV